MFMTYATQPLAAAFFLLAAALTAPAHAATPVSPVLAYDTVYGGCGQDDEAAPAKPAADTKRKSRGYTGPKA
jgi:hypothetical protein